MSRTGTTLLGTKALRRSRPHDVTMSETESSDDTAVTLYRLQACPFCERVVRTLQEHGVSYQSRFVETDHSERDAVKRLTGTRIVPALVDESTGVTMAESENIVEYVETVYGGA